MCTVSIIIPAHNAAPWIAATLGSVLRQTWGDFECLLIDDGSTDATVDVVEQFGDPRVRVVRGPRGGVSAARNVGLRLARGRHVTFLDSDDLWAPDFLASLLAPLEANPALQLAYCRYVMFHDGSDVEKVAVWTNVQRTGNIWWDMLRDAQFCMGTWVARRELVVRAGFFDESLAMAEDRDFLLRLLALACAQNAGCAVSVPRTLLFYRQRKGSGVRNAVLALETEWNIIARHLEHPGVPADIRRRGYSFLAFKMAVIAALAQKDIRSALRWYGKAVALCPLHWNLYVLPLRKLGLALLPARRVELPASIAGPGGAQARTAILFVTARADFGGGPEHLWQLLLHAPAEFAPCVACPDDYPYFDRYAALVGQQGMLRIPHRRFSLASAFSLRRFCRERNVRVIHSHGKGAGLYARFVALLTGIPCVHTFHGVHMGEYGPVKRWLYRWYERGSAALAGVRTGIAVSRGEREQIVREGLFPDSRLVVVENGVRVPETPVGLAQAPPFVIVSFTRFDHAKNSELALDIAEALRGAGRGGEFRILLVGEGEGREALLRAARVRGLEQVIQCPGASLTPHGFLDGALCYLSTSRWEGLPLGVLEAMAHGLPVVLSDVVGNRDVAVHGESGLLYPAGDAAGAAALLLQLADDPDLRRRLAGQGRAHVLRHNDVRNMAAATYALLGKAAGSGCGGGNA